MDQMKNTHLHEDDAMFTKKHLGPVNCASCEKDIVNMQGMPADYYAWKRLPQRGAPDRIARYGQGFSKLLSNLQYHTDPLNGGYSMNDSIEYQHGAGSPMKNQNFRKTQPDRFDGMTDRGNSNNNPQARNKSSVPNTRQKMKSSLPQQATTNPTVDDTNHHGRVSGSLMENSAG